MASRTGLFLRAFTLLALSCVAFAAQGNSGPVFSTFQGKGAALEISKTGPEYTSIRFDGSTMERNTLVKDYENYDFIGIDGEAIITQDGAPAVPHVSRFYQIPATGGVDLLITSSEYELVENYNPLPYVEEGHVFRSDSKDPMIYGRNEWYPANIAEMSEPMIMRDFRVVTVRLNPVQVNPVTHQARIYHDIQVEIVPNDLPSVNEITRYRRPTGSWAPIYQQLIPNLDDAALDDATTTPGTYMIFARTNVNVDPWVDSLATWKKRSGHDVVVRQQATWSASQIVTDIRNTWQNAPENSPVEFVCLMGDPEQQTFGIPTNGGNEYDHTYALATTGDDIEDIGVGRFCASSASDFANIFGKTVGYERSPYMTDPTWFKKAFLYAGISMELTSNYTTFQWIGDMLQRNTNVDSVFLLTHNQNQVNNSDITGQLNQGRGIFLWRGSWIGGMGNEVAGQCNNGQRTPICLTVTCATGQYDGGTSVSESWVLAGTAGSPKGGVTGLGMATAGTHPPENLCVTGGLGYAIAVSQTEHIGHCVNQAKAWLVPTFGNGSGSQQNFTRWFNLMGDPGLSIWTDTPQIIDVTHTGSLNLGARSISVHVADHTSGEPVVDALVTAWKGAECYIKGVTDANGDVVVPISVETAGTLLLTVTKRNVKPYLADVACAAASENVAFFSMTVDDDNANGTQGNGDGVANPGEIVDLGVVMRNAGTSVTVTGITANLTTTNSKAAVVQGTSTYSNLAPGAQAMGAAAFRLNLSHDLQHREIVPLRFAVTSSGTPTTSMVDMSIVAARATYVSHAISGGAFNPGTTRNLTVTVKNNGAIPLTGVTATLTSASPFVAATVSSATFPDIAANAQVANTASPFTLASNNLTFPGHQARMTLIVTGNGGFADTTYFNVAVGTAGANDPCGPDGYGYYAYDNTDASYELHPTYDWVDISAGLGTNLNLSDPGEKTAITQIFGTARRLPFTFRYYGIDYDTLTITASGTVAFGNQAWADHFRNYPVPAQTAPRAMIAPYWDDLKTNGAGQGVWWYNDTANNRVVIQWKAGCGSSSFNTNLNFQVILLGQDLTPTFDGNGRILFQYNDVTMNLPPAFGQEISGSTIGIHDESQTVGLQLAYRDQLSPGCASLVDGRAILITTDARNLFGAVIGTVRDAETNLPMTGVHMSIDGHNYNSVTDVNGNYILDHVLIGEYTVRAHKDGFNDSFTANILVELDDTVSTSFTLLHPEFDLSEEALTIAYPGQSAATFNIINDGNGPLDYDIHMSYTLDGQPVEDWGAVARMDLSGQTGDFQMLGCEFAGDYWYVSGASGPTGTNWIYRFDRDGQFVPPAIPQPSVSAFGWYDLAYDGEYLYGSEDGTGTIVGIDMNGTVHATIPSPLNPTRAIAYDPALDRFWVADFTQNIYSIDRDGNVFAQIVNEGADELAITGLAWWPQDPEGYKLYIFSRDGAGNQTKVTRMHPVTYDRDQVGILEGGEFTAGGCAITTGGHNDMMVNFGAILQNNTGDRLGVYQMKFDQEWAQITPAAGSVEGAQEREITLNADLSTFRDDIHHLSLSIYNDVLDTTIILPVTIDITTDITDRPGELIPREYSLAQNYPNPFNPNTTIQYTLKESGLTTLTVYNIAGQKVAQLVNGRQEAGAYTVNFDAARLPSGMYFYRLESGSFSQAAKMILLK
ncbi:MAG: T9SS type A sorting domain-containing protein [bacterium]|nr:T9SS type A sorting domain-containing protein [bacterium]